MCILAGLVFTHTLLFSQIELVPLAEGFTRPVAISNAGDSRLFIVEQAGRIHIIDSTGNRISKPFLDITGQVTSDGNEQGLLGLAFHPEYATNGLFFVNYTGPGGATVISRFMVQETNPDLADPASESIILGIPQPFQNHNGGDIKFGPDGYLYIGTGDGGSGGDPGNRAQDPSSLLGKMLRIDIDGGDPYVIPENNPFVDDTTTRDEIWALGLRNPWRFSFDRTTGDLWIGDVGQNEIEEIHFQPSTSMGGENYGWRCYEGNSIYNSAGCLGFDHYVFPVYQYLHDALGGCSVTGGYVYRGSEYPTLAGQYIFSDYCTDRIWSLEDSSGTWILSGTVRFPGNGFSTFGEDRNGTLYVAGLSSGVVYRITSSGPLSNWSPGQMQKSRVYPNPVKESLWVESLHDHGFAESLVLFGPDGKIMYTTKPIDNPFQLELNDISAGCYILEIRYKQGSEFHRIVKH